MNSKKAFFRLTIFSFVMAALIFACSNLGDDFSSGNSNSSTSISYTVESGKGIVSGRIDAGNGGARTIMPDISAVKSSVSSYTAFAYGRKSDGTTVPETSPVTGIVNGTLAADNLNFSIGLDYGTWTLVISALDSSGKTLLTQSASGITVNSSTPIIEKNFSLSFVQQASETGALDLTLSYEGGLGITNIKYTFTPRSLGSAVSGTVAASGNSIQLNSDLDAGFGAMTPGLYDMTIEFLDSYGGPVVRLDQTVQIYSNITTSKIDGSAPYINSGSISVTADVVKEYQLTTIYLGGSGASDTNSGTKFDPVATMSRAMGIVNESLLAPDDGFKIYVQANVALTENIAVSSGQKVSIIGTKTSGGNYAVSGGGSYSLSSSGDALNLSYLDFDSLKGITISSGEATLTNCNIKNGSATNGGGISVTAAVTATLNNCVITGCEAGDWGGAVYVNADSAGGTAQVNLTDCIIGADSATCATSNNYSNKAGGGGGIYVGANGKAVLSGTSVLRNYSTVAGGGIHSKGSLEITGGVINKNLAGYGGGGLYVAGNLAKTATAVINGCVIGQSAASSVAASETDCGNCSLDQGGGGLFVDEHSTLTTTSGFSVLRNYAAGEDEADSGGGIKLASNAAFSNVEVSYNYAEGSGGGIYNASGISLSVSGGAISGNTSAAKGGGVYNAGTVFMSGSAVVGDSSKTATATENAYSNKAAEGGGIHSTGTVYLGYSGASAKSALTGGVFYNYPDGICVQNGTLYMDSGSVSYNYERGVYAGSTVYETYGTVTMTGGTISGNGNSATENGGGIYAGYHGRFTMSGGTISGNTAKNGGGLGIANVLSTFTMSSGTISGNTAVENGGGIYSDMDGTYTGSITMSGGSVSGNKAGSGFNGNGVYINNGPFAMSGAAAISADNDVYLVSGKTITVNAALTGTAPVATITPEVYANGTQVLTGSAVMANYGKFAVTKDGDTSWGIKSDGTLYTTVTSVYISESGSDATGNGTKTAPYKTLQKAADAFSDKTAAVTGTGAAAAFTNKVYVLSDYSFTGGAGVTDSYNFEVVGMKGGTDGAAVTFNCDTPSQSAFYIASGQKIKFSNIKFTKANATANNYATLLAAEGGALYLENSSVKNMIANNCAAIAAEGDVYLKDVEISGNTTNGNASGSSVFGPAVNVTKGTLHIQGKVLINSNSTAYTKDGNSLSKEMNVWIGENNGTVYYHPIDVEAAITGSKIGVTLYDSVQSVREAFTSGYGAAMAGESPAAYFTSDDGYEVSLNTNGTEAALTIPSGLYVSASGSDTTGSGTAASPYATLERAIKQTEFFNDSGADYTVNIVGTLAQNAVIDSDGGFGAKPVANSITIKGSGSSESILTTAGGTDAILAFMTDGVEWTIEGIGFTGGASTSAGGALDISTGASAITIKDCAFTNCSATVSGGAIYVEDGTVCNIQDTSFTNCSAKDGGAIYNHGGALTLSGISISGCSATEKGGAIHNCDYNSKHGSVTLDGETSIAGSIYLAEKDYPLYVKSASFALKSGSSAIVLSPEMQSETAKYAEGDIVVRGSGSYSITAAQCAAFALSDSAYSVVYDSAIPGGKIKNVSFAGGITVSLGGNISLVLSVPKQSGDEAAFVLQDSSSGSAVNVTPTSARIEIRQNGAAIFYADAQSVTAAYLGEGSYELYGRAVYNGIAYDASEEFTIGGSGGGGDSYFHETVEELPAGTDGSAGTSATYVYFGDWPQTIKESSVKVDETNIITMGGATYYLGDDNNYYAKVTASVYSSGDTTCTDGTVLQSGTVYYFKVEPIKWRVLNPDESGQKILLAENILTANIPYYGATSARTLSGNTIYANNYKYSNIRAYLNGTVNQFVTDGGTSNTYTVDWSGTGFLQTAFTESAQDLIATTTIDNSAESTSDATGSISKATSFVCDDTSDKIFLLSEKEATTTDYGFAGYRASGTDSARIREATDYAKANYAYQSVTSGYGCHWWLRSPYNRYDSESRNVKNNGEAENDIPVYNKYVGVCPALSVSY